MNDICWDIRLFDVVVMGFIIFLIITVGLFILQEFNNALKKHCEGKEGIQSIRVCDYLNWITGEPFACYNTTINCSD